LNPGDKWGGFRIIRYLGSGAMGEVFLAHNELVGRDVAVKRVRRAPDRESEEKIAAERTGAELERRMSGLDPRITKVYWYGEISGDLAIEMEYVEGRDLSAVLNEGALPAGRAAVIALELCEMLENLRTAGVIHGDLKPKNIRIDQAERIRVMDFGVAKALAQTRDYTAALFGSIAYCSPERLESGSMDGASDLWAVGVMLYQMLSGKLPFEGETPDRLERRIRSGQAPAPLPFAVPGSLRSICARMLSHSLSARYATPMAAHQDLKSFLSGKPVPEYFEPGFDGTQRTVRDLDATVRTARPLGTARPQTLWPVLRRLTAVAIAALLAIAIFIYMLVQPHYKAWADGRELKHEIETEHVNADTAWTRYQDIVNRKKIGIATWGIGSPLKAKLVAAGDAPILDFRNNDFPTAREGTWRRSVTYFSRALELDSGDKNVKGKLRLCEAHVERITANGKQAAMNDAAEKFREAAELMHKSPDPWIGMERLYAYLGDCEREQEAIDKAAKLGHPETRRDMVFLADAYARRALQTVRDSAKFQTMPDTETGALRHARADYERARVLYAQLGSFSNAPNGLIAAVRGNEQVNNRLRELNPMVPRL